MKQRPATIGLAIVAAALAVWWATRERAQSPSATPPAASPAPAGPSPAAHPISGSDPGAGPQARAPLAREATTPAPAEEDLMARLRDEVDRNPALAIEIAREAERRYPQGRYADERAFLEMRALVHLNRISAARERAEEFFGRHRTSPFAERVHRLTGVHPRPRLPR